MSTYPSESECIRILRDAGCKKRVIIHCCTVRTVAGEMIKKIGSTARYEIEKLIEGKADLQLWIKVKKDWRDSDVLLKNFGYDAESIDK